VRSRFVLELEFQGFVELDPHADVFEQTVFRTMEREQAGNLQRWLQMVENQNAADAQMFGALLGMAMIDLWGNLPRSTQEQVFEAAVVAGARTGDERLLRERLAIFLHNYHPRTAGDGETKGEESRAVKVAGQNGGLP
jgi:hypothetical protein